MGHWSLVKASHPALHRPTSRISRVDREVCLFLDAMHEIMLEAHGVGLAANQLGDRRRIAIVLVEEKLYELINLEIVKTWGTYRDFEGCLSVPGWAAQVDRPERVTAKAVDRQGNAVRIRGVGLLARALLHEADHLDGQLYTEKAVPDTLRRLTVPQESDTLEILTD